MKKPTKKDYEKLGREIVSCPEKSFSRQRFLREFHDKFNIPMKKSKFKPPPPVLKDMFPDCGTLSRKIIK